MIEKGGINISNKRPCVLHSARPYALAKVKTQCRYGEIGLPGVYVTICDIVVVESQHNSFERTTENLSIPSKLIFHAKHHLVNL